MKDITFLVYNPTVTDLEIDKEDMRTLMSDLNKNNFFHIDEQPQSLSFSGIHVLFLTVDDVVHDSLVTHADYVCLSRIGISEGQDTDDRLKLDTLESRFSHKDVIYDIELVQLAVFFRALALNPMGLIRFMYAEGPELNRDIIKSIVDDAMGK